MILGNGAVADTTVSVIESATVGKVIGEIVGNAMGATIAPSAARSEIPRTRLLAL